MPDAQAVEGAFERRVAELSEAAEGASEQPSVEEQHGAESQGQSQESAEVGGQLQREQSEGIRARQYSVPQSDALVERSRAISHQPRPGIDKSVLALPEPRRHRNKGHLRFVAQQAYLICGRTPYDPHT